MKVINEDMCSYCIDDQQTLDSSGYIKDKKLYCRYISNLLYYDNLYLVNIEKNIDKEYIHDISIGYVKDIITIEESLNYFETNEDNFLVAQDKKIKNKNKTPDQKKRKKELQKFNDKYNKLLIINSNYHKWANEFLLSDYYKNEIISIINKHMYFLDEYINKNGKQMKDLRNTYKWIYDELYNHWEIFDPDEENDIKDLDLILKQKWEEYAIYESDEYKKYLKI